MYLYKAVTGVITHKRLSINSFTGVELPTTHADLDELVANGTLTRETVSEVAEPVAAPKAVAEPQNITPKV